MKRLSFSSMVIQRNSIIEEIFFWMFLDSTALFHGPGFPLCMGTIPLSGESPSHCTSGFSLNRARENMKLLIPRITDSTKRKDLREFANRVLEKLFRLPFSTQPRIVSYQILSISDSTGVTQRHGLIDVTPDDAALRVIRKLNGAYLKEKRVGVKQYKDVT
ncbi:MAG: hypothetical protein KZQ73_05545 [Candidatus Thiodiazotropha sp. (ex Semelilucina semeliformis)]|nr:hypothetical protein [Candidatus Thiodiazotropha sp. (ex Semelilucina semeliformis)]